MRQYKKGGHDYWRYSGWLPTLILKSGEKLDETIASSGIVQLIVSTPESTVADPSP
jgi:hypothetical protein